MKRYRVINKTRFYLFITSTFVLTVMILIFITSSIRVHGINMKNKYHELVVVEGDTLWNIALKYKPAKYDVRSMVFKIKEFNNLDTSYIYPGETIKIPIIKK